MTRGTLGQALSLPIAQKCKADHTDKGNGAVDFDVYNPFSYPCSLFAIYPSVPTSTWWPLPRRGTISLIGCSTFGDEAGVEAMYTTRIGQESAAYRQCILCYIIV